MTPETTFISVFGALCAWSILAWLVRQVSVVFWAWVHSWNER